MDTIDSAMYLRLSCLKIAPLGLPVVPEEYRRVAISPKPTGAFTAESVLAPLDKNASHESTFLESPCGSEPRQIEITGTSGQSSRARAKRLGIPTKKILDPLERSMLLMSAGGAV